LLFDILDGAIDLLGLLRDGAKEDNAEGTRLGSTGGHGPTPPKEPMDVDKLLDGLASKLDGLFSGEEDGEPFSRSVREEKPPAARAADHDHIPSTALDQQKRLEQLERMKDAGLLDDEEYKQKKREIKRGS